MEKIIRLSLKNILIALACGVFLSLSFPGYPLLCSALAWVALIPFLILLREPMKLRDAFALSLSMGVGLYGGLMYWLLCMHPLTWLGMSNLESLGMVILAWILVSFIMAIAVALMGTLLNYALSRTSAPWLLTLLPALFWIALEYLQGLGILGFTWGTLATSQYRFLPLIQIVSVTGSFFLSGLIVAVNAALSVLFKEKKFIPLIAVSLFLIGILGYGSFMMDQPLAGKSFRYALVQGNIKQDEKWQKDTLTRTVNHYLELSDKAKGANLLVWPETAVPQFLRHDPPLYFRLMNYAKNTDRYLLTGTLDYDNGDPKALKLYNGATIFDPSGRNLGFDYKTHLVPFGEYLPFREWMPPFIAKLLGQFNIVAEDYAPAEKPKTLDLPFAKLGTGICFDSIFPWVIYEKVRAGAEVLVVVTNDAWYKKTTACYQHNAQSVLRAVETGRYLLRAANTGISCAIDPHGRIQGMTEIYQPAVVEGLAMAQKGLTPYARFRDWLGILSSMLAGLSLLLARLRRLP